MLIKINSMLIIPNGPMVEGLEPLDAVERLNKYQNEFAIRKRKLDLYRSGEELFALTETPFPQLMTMQKQLGLLDQLYTLYMDVINTVDEEWREILWDDVVENIDDMSSKVEMFAGRCKKMPKKTS